MHHAAQERDLRRPRETDAPYELGVLFVHGIGEQQRGEALAAWSDSIYSFLHRLLTRDDDVVRAREAREQRQRHTRWPKNDKECAELHALETEAACRAHAERALDQGLLPIRLSQTYLRSSPDEEPAHLVLEVTPPWPQGELLTEDNAAPRTEWLVAESWWAQEFSPPQARVILRWALNVAPVVVLAHLATSMARLRRFPRWSVRRAVGVLLGLAAYACALVALVVGLLVLLVLLVLETLPLPKLTAAARTVGTKLAGSVGDSYVLVTGASEYAAMVTRVQNDLIWMTRTCKRVAVVAHSQGAVVAYRALQGGPDVRADLFVTVGSGLGKLSEIETLRARTPSRRFTVMALGYPLFGLALTVVMRRFYPPGLFTTGLLLANASAYALMSFFAYFQLVQDRPQEQLRRRRSMRALPQAARTPWIDYFTSADLVPNGPLFDEDPDWLCSYETGYESSWIADHSRYHKNEDGLIAPLVLELGRAAGGHVGRSLEALRRRVQLLGRRRTWRCSLLVHARLLLLGSAALAVPYQWAGLSGWGASLRERTPALLKQVLAGLGEAVLLPSGLDLPADAVLATLFAAVATCAALWVTTIAWRRIGARDVSRFYRGDDPDFGGLPLLAFAAVVVGLMTLAVGPVLLAVLPTPDELVLWLGLCGLVALIPCFLRALEVLDDPEPTLADPRERQRHLERRQVEALQAGLLGAVLAVPLAVVALLATTSVDWGGLPWWVDVLGVVLAMSTCIFVPLVGGRVLRDRLGTTLSAWGHRWVAGSVRVRGLRDAAG